MHVWKELLEALLKGRSCLGIKVALGTTTMVMIACLNGDEEPCGFYLFIVALLPRLPNLRSFFNGSTRKYTIVKHKNNPRIILS